MTLGSEWTDVVKGIRGRRVGDQFEFETERPPMLFTFTHPREDRGDTRAEVKVEERKSQALVELLRDRVGLVSSRTKAGLANAITDRHAWQGDMRGIVEIVCNAALDTFREGEPFIYLKDAERGDLGYLVEYLLPRGETTVFYGDGMSGKSLTALCIAAAVATGYSLPGIATSQTPGPVLYLDWETKPATHLDYLNRIEAGNGLVVPREMLIYRRMARGFSDELRLVKEQVDRYGVVLIVIDSMIPACAAEPESAEVVNRFFNALRELGEITKQVISHITKAEALRNGMPRPFGSVFTTNLARSTWAVKRARLAPDNVLEIGLYHTKTNVGRLYRPRGLRMTFSSSTIILEDFDLAEVPELDTHAPLSPRIKSYLTSGSATVADIATELGAKEGSVRQALSRMKGVVRVEAGGGRGKRTTWGLTMEGIDEIPF